MTEYERWLTDNKVPLEDTLSFDGKMSYSWHGDIMELLRETELARSRGLPLPKIPDYRKDAISLFGFAILDQATVDFLKPYGPFIEVGAGTGYWSHELRKNGIDSIATDPNPLGTVHVKPARIFEPLDRINAFKALEKYGTDRTLLMVWPDMDNWAAQAVGYFLSHGGRRIVHVGENGGCTGDEELCEIFDKELTEVAEQNIPRWFGIRDYLSVYEVR